MSEKARKPLGFIAVLLLFAIIAGVMLSLTAPVKASSFRWARWEIELDFPNDTTEAILWVTIGYTDNNGQEHVTDVKDFDIDCDVEGNLVIQNNKAFFDGTTSYLACEVPSIQEKVLEMTQFSQAGPLIIGPACEAKRPFFTSQVRIEDSPISSTPMNPLFYREDMIFGLPLDTINNQAEIATIFDESYAISDPFTLNAAGVHRVGMLYNKSGADYDTFSVVDGVVNQANPTTLTGPIFLSTLASDVYFGYHPITDDYFEGTIGSFKTDPVCTGTG